MNSDNTNYQGLAALDSQELARKQAEAARPVRHDAIPNHRHNWIAASWQYRDEKNLHGITIKTIRKLYCPDCKETQEVMI